MKTDGREGRDDRPYRALQAALDAADMGHWELHLATGSIDRSSRHDKIFGYSELQSSWDLSTTLAHIAADDQARVQRAFLEAELSGSIDVEARVSSIDACDQGDANAVRWVQVRGRTFYAAGAPESIAGIIVDITQRRAVEERLRQARNIEALGQLTGGVAHDFNNLLQVISGSLQIIGRHPDTARREQILGAMRQAVDRGATLCRQLLAFSRRQELKPESTDLKRVIGAMHESLDRSLRRDVRTRMAFAEGLWPADVDRGELESVILNLALNAGDAMPKGGTLEIQASNAPALADPEASGDFVRIDIADTGVGMSPEALAHAFEPFYTTKEVGRGSGLGLAHAHGFARASGGILRIASSSGRGTQVSLYLRRSLAPPQMAACAGDAALASSEIPSPAPSAHVLALASHVPAPSAQVLLVEDDDEVAALAVEMIHELGYGATRVSNAEAALGALAGRRCVDIVFSDVMMPGEMDGVELAKEISRRRPNLPVLLTSGYAEAAKRNAGTHQIKIIPKPYRMDDLRDAFAAVRRDARNPLREH